MGIRRPEHGVQVRTFVAERKVEEVAAVRGEDALDLANERVELGVGIVVLVEVDAAEANEHGDRRAQFREEFASSGTKARVDRGQQPFSDDSSGSALRLVAGTATGGLESCDDAYCRGSPRHRGSRRSRRAERFQRGLIQHHLASIRVVLGVRQRVDQPPGKNVDQLNVGVADDEAPGSPHGHRDLHREPHAGRRA